MTKAETILVQLFTAIDTGNIGATCHRDRSEDEPFGLDDLPAVNLKPLTDNADKLGSGLKRHLFDVTFDVHVAGSPSDSAADVVIDKMHQSIMARQQLYDLIADIEYVSREWDNAMGDESRGKVSVKYQITYSNLAKQL